MANTLFSCMRRNRGVALTVPMARVVRMVRMVPKVRTGPVGPGQQGKTLGLFALRLARSSQQRQGGDGRRFRAQHAGTQTHRGKAGGQRGVLF